MPVHGLGFENRRNEYRGQFQEGDITTEAGLQLAQENGYLILTEQAVAP